MFKYLASICLIFCFYTRSSAAQDTTQVKRPVFYPNAELTERTEQTEKFPHEITITSFTPMGDSVSQATQLIQNGTDKQHLAWLDYALKDIEANGFRDDSNGWIPDDVFTGCKPYTLDTAGWLSNEATGQYLAIVKAVCLHKKKNYGNDWYLNVVSLIELDEQGGLASVLSSHGGLDNDWDNDETSIVNIEFIGNVDDDSDLEIVLMRIAYAGASYVVLDRNQDGTYSQTRIHHASWD